MIPPGEGFFPAPNFRLGLDNPRKFSDNVLDIPPFTSINDSFSGMTINSMDSTSETPINNSATFLADNINIPKPSRVHKKSHNNLLNTSMPVINEKDLKGIHPVSSSTSLMGMKNNGSGNNSFTCGKSYYGGSDYPKDINNENSQKMKNENGLMDSITSINSSLMKSNNSMNDSQFLNQLGNNSNVQMNKSISATNTNILVSTTANTNCSTQNNENQLNLEQNFGQGVNDYFLPFSGGSNMGQLFNINNNSNNGWMNNNSGGSLLGAPCSINIPFSMKNNSRTSMITEGRTSQAGMGDSMGEELPILQVDLEPSQPHPQRYQQQYQMQQDAQPQQFHQQRFLLPEHMSKSIPKDHVEGLNADGPSKPISNTSLGYSVQNSGLNINNRIENLFFYPWGISPLNFIENMKKAIEESQGNQSRTKIVKYIGKLTEEERKRKIEKYLEKKKNRKGKMIRYDIRKNLADQRKRVQGKFVKTKLKTDIFLSLGGFPGPREDPLNSKFSPGFEKKMN